MAQRLATALIAVCSLALSGCNLLGHASAAAPAIGDACLVGSWTLLGETSQSGYSFNNQALPVAGLAGARLTLDSGGDEKEVFAGSEPLVGTLQDGRKLAITIGGSIDYRIRADGHTYRETGTDIQLPTTATLDGQPVSYHSSYTPGTGTYACSAASLTLTTSDGSQIDRWAKG